MVLQCNLDAREAASVKQVCPDVPSGHFILQDWKPDTRVEAKLAKLSKAMQDNPFGCAVRQAACADIMVIRNNQREKYIDAQDNVERCYNDIEVTNNLTSHRCETSQRLMENNLKALKLKVAVRHPGAQQELHSYLLDHPRHVEIYGGTWDLLAIKYKYLFRYTMMRNESVEFMVRAEKLLLHHFKSIVGAETWWASYQQQSGTDGMIFSTLRN
jgi:hypothetical protein